MPYGSWVKDLSDGFFVAMHKEIGGTVIVR
jgi:hypothetical protein